MPRQQWLVSDKIGVTTLKKHGNVTSDPKIYTAERGALYIPQTTKPDRGLAQITQASGRDYIRATWILLSDASPPALQASRAAASC